MTGLVEAVHTSAVTGRSRIASPPALWDRLPACQTAASIGETTGIDKKGWEYLWVRYADSVDDTAKALVKKPLAAYVERVYEYGDFSLLGV